MDSNQAVKVVSPRRSSITPLTVLLGAVMVFFCAVLVFVYAATKHANPVMLDQQGHPLNRSSGQAK